MRATGRNNQRHACWSTLSTEEQVVILTLEISPASELSPGDTTRHAFGEEGGSIGRAATNSWVLTQNKVSGQHAQIAFRNGVFYIQDTSRNGVAVNSPDNRLVRNRPYALKTGDRIFIEPYEIRVWIEAVTDRSTGQSAVDPFAQDDPFSPRPETSVPLAGLGPLAEPSADEEVDPLKFFDPVGGRPPARKPERAVSPADEILEAHYQPPAAVPAPESVASEDVPIPQDYNPLAPDEVPSAPITPPPIRPRPGEGPRGKSTSAQPPTIRQPGPRGAERAEPGPEPASSAAPSRTLPADTSARAVGSAADLAELLAGAGVPDAIVTPELSRNLGQILRIVVSGLMDVLQSRQRIKEEFRMHQTLFRPIDNNPLKFSANVEDALYNLLVKRNAAYLAPVDAFGDAFDDLRDHELAMLAGMREAFEAMLAEFDADKLQQDFDRQLAKVSLPLVPAKLRYWDLYRAKRDEMAKDPEATFARLFSEEFRRAYEEHFRELRAKRRGRPPRQSPD